MTNKLNPSEVLKVSINLNQEYVNLADKLAEITGKNRTDVLTAFIGEGVDPLIKKLETTWSSLLTAGNLEGEKKKKIKTLLANLKKTKEDWEVVYKSML